MMNFDDYQKRAKKTRIYPVEEIIRYPALGLAGECGEVCEIIKKYTRDNLWNPDLEDDIKQFDKMTAKVELELGDVLWYVANLADDLGLSMQTIATKNIDKLRDRQRRNVLHGEGDDR